MNNRKALTNYLVSAGFTLLRHSKHEIWRCPCGHALLTISSSRAGGRSDQNARAQASRTLRNCTPRQEAKAA